MAGHKHFFTPYLGLRYYTNADFYHNLSKSKHISGGKRKIDIMAISYGFNVDFLGNFMSNEMLDFGGFVGVGVGATTLMGKYVEIEAIEAGQSVRTTGLDVALNFGLRTNIATHHGVELAVRVPFMPIELYKVKQGGAEGTITDTFGQTFSIMARYTFSF
ncbi:outer membrane beta-barrel protein [Helicobacter sp. 23-1045]